jgi:hypothetical protein
MKKRASLARRLSRISGEQKAPKPIEITEVIEGAHILPKLPANLRPSPPGRVRQFGLSSREGPARSRALVASRELTPFAK